jgi:hypothetical protein
LASILFVTYRRLPFNNGLNVGSHDVYVASGDICHPARERSAVQNQVQFLASLLLPEISVYDKVVIYLGADSFEEAIAIADGLSPDKLVFVTCDCDLSRKQDFLDERGFSGSEIVLCECNDVKTMSALIAAHLHRDNLTLAYGECTRIAEMVSKPVLQPI